MTTRPSTATSDQTDDRLEMARQLVAHLEAGRENDAQTSIAALAGFRDSVLFQEVGRLTRELHSALDSFVADAHLAKIAEQEMPNAAERLHYVIATTEEAANKTLGAIEESLPRVDSLRDDARRLSEQWQRLDSQQLNVDNYRELSGELTQFLSVTDSNTLALHDKLSEVLMAQSYQDITGQIIRKVIDLVNDVEGKLVQLIRLSGPVINEQRSEESSAKPKKGRDIEAMGPAVPGVDKADTVNGQDDVDDLLSSLGF